jgi:hypothetical protein
MVQGMKWRQSLTGKTGRVRIEMKKAGSTVAGPAFMHYSALFLGVTFLYFLDDSIGYVSRAGHVV